MGGQVKDEPASIAREHERRLELWNALKGGDVSDVAPAELRSLGVYGGAQGIWTDKTRTGPISADGKGVAVCVLHTGDHYPDDLTDDGVIYHYPATARPPGRDGAEIASLKSASRLRLPIFAVLPGARRRSARMVQLAWVVDWDDDSRQFLILFGDRPDYHPAAAATAPFELHDFNEVPLKRKAKRRSNQQRFRFQVLSNLGGRCAVCPIAHPQLIKAAHLCDKAHRGSDDWRNGVPLCSTHHDALDAHLFYIEPKTLRVVVRPDCTARDLGIQFQSARFKDAVPHRQALEWRRMSALRAKTWNR